MEGCSHFLRVPLRLSSCGLFHLISAPRLVCATQLIQIPHLYSAISLPYFSIFLCPPFTRPPSPPNPAAASIFQNPRVRVAEALSPGCVHLIGHIHSLCEMYDAIIACECLYYTCSQHGGLLPDRWLKHESAFKSVRARGFTLLVAAHDKQKTCLLGPCERALMCMRSSGRCIVHFESQRFSRHVFKNSRGVASVHVRTSMSCCCRVGG